MDSNQKPISVTEQHKMMADSAPALIWVAGTDKSYQFFNAEWLRFTGRTLAEEIGDGWTKGIHPEDFDRCLALYFTSFDERTAYKMEYRLRRYDGQYRWIVDQGTPRYDSKGDFAGYIGSCMDIDELLATERLRNEYVNSSALIKEQQLNEELAAANEELAAANEEQYAINEEFTAVNEELQESRENLITLNNELEKRIAFRTKELVESEHRLQSMVDSAPFPIGVYIGKEMRILMANTSIMDVWGKGYDVVGQLYSTILPELTNQQIFSQLDGVFTTGIPFHNRNQRIDLVVDGVLKVYYFNYSFTPLFDADGKVYGVMNTAADVTDLNIAKQLVEQNEENLYHMILQAPVAMCILWGENHVITVANQLMLELWGKPYETVINKPVFEALPDARNQGLEQIMQDVYHGTSFKATAQPVTLFRGGKYEDVYQNFVYEPYKNTSGEIIGIIAITVDVTEQVLAIQKIEQSEAELINIKGKLEVELEAGKLLQRQKDDFIGIASHELKTPLTSITAIVQILSRKLVDSKDPFVVGAMDKANIQIKKMISLINGFLNVSRLESGKLLIDTQKFYLVELIKSQIDDVQLTTTGHKIQLNVAEEVEIVADRDKIGSVISNLLSNAIKYSPKGNYVEVNCKRINESVEVSIRDEGMGIKPDQLEKLFDRYYRVETAHTRDISGFGIGLYLSSEIIKHHHGKIWVESESGKGSTFHFSLPLGVATV